MALEITGDRISLTRSEAMARALLNSYSPAEQTTFSTEQDLWFAAARERIAKGDDRSDAPALELMDPVSVADLLSKALDDEELAQLKKLL